MRIKKERRNTREKGRITFSKRDPVVIAGMNFCRRSTTELTPDMRRALLSGAGLNRSASGGLGALSLGRTRRDVNNRGALIALGLATGATLAVLNFLVTIFVII
jgi:hypothetical protein